MSGPAASRDFDTAEGFADYFRTIGAGSRYAPEQFLDFFRPLDPEAFRGRRIVELGLGHGCFLWHWGRVGPARLAGIDLGDAVEAARARLAHLEDAVLDLRRGDLTTAFLATDFLVARHTVYLDRPTLESWLRHPDVDRGSVYLIHRNRNSWTFGGRKRPERA